MRIAVVTGASSGIGREFASQITKCYRNLDEIWLVARSTDKLQQCKSTLEMDGKVFCRIFDGDLQRDYLYTRIEKALDKEKPDIRVLVNAAGFGKIGTVKELSSKVQEDMVDVNCRALTKLTRLCLPYLSRGSRIINVASAAAFAPQPGFAVYAATKAYVLNFSKGIGQEVSKQGIITTAVCPGPVDTPFFDKAGQGLNHIKERFMAEPEAVVRQALIDTRRGKCMSVYGNAMKGAKLAAKLLPDRIIQKAMDRISHNS